MFEEIRIIGQYKFLFLYAFGKLSVAGTILKLETQEMQLLLIFFSLSLFWKIDNWCRQKLIQQVEQIQNTYQEKKKWNYF